MYAHELGRLHVIEVHGRPGVGLIESQRQIAHLQFGGVAHIEPPGRQGAEQHRLGIVGHHLGHASPRISRGATAAARELDVGQLQIFRWTARNPAGPWSEMVTVKAVTDWEGPCPFWDDDGQAYLVHSVHGAGPLILHRLSADGTQLLDHGAVT